MKMYKLTEYSDVKYSEEELHDISCKHCGTTLHESMVNYDDGDPQHYFHEDQWGQYFCENIECIWSNVHEHDLIQPEEIKGEKDE